MSLLKYAIILAPSSKRVIKKAVYNPWEMPSLGHFIVSFGHFEVITFKLIFYILKSKLSDPFLVLLALKKTDVSADSCIFVSLIKLVRSFGLILVKLLFFPARFIDQDELFFFATSELMFIYHEPLLVQHTHTL